MKIIPRRMFLFVFVVLASVGRTDAQLIRSLLDFLSNFDFQALIIDLCPVISPVFEGFGIGLPFCGTDSPTSPVPAPSPTPKKKITTGAAAPVAPPAARP